MEVCFLQNREQKTAQENQDKVNSVCPEQVILKLVLDIPAL